MSSETKRYPALELKSLEGSEPLLAKGKPLPFSVVDFWRWSASDLVSNSTRGRFAEFIVASALGFDNGAVRDEWQSFDLRGPGGIKVEVKSSGFVQSWAQKELSKPVFSISKSILWERNAKIREDETRSVRQAEVYVFALHKCVDKSKVNALDLDQWEFYVVPTSTLNYRKKEQSFISLKALQALARGLPYSELSAAVVEAGGKMP